MVLNYNKQKNTAMQLPGFLPAFSLFLMVIPLPYSQTSLSANISTAHAG